jgi:hypothetical protein
MRVHVSDSCQACVLSVRLFALTCYQIADIVSSLHAYCASGVLFLAVTCVTCANVSFRLSIYDQFNWFNLTKM